MKGFLPMDSRVKGAFLTVFGGVQGNHGIGGSRGTQGNPGETGFQGTQGGNGVKGSRGTQGTPGDNGFQGVQGNLAKCTFKDR